MQVIKRDGRIVEYDRSKIYNAIQKAFNANNVHIDVDAITASVEEKLNVYKLKIRGFHDVKNPFLFPFYFPFYFFKSNRNISCCCRELRKLLIKLLRI